MKMEETNLNEKEINKENENIISLFLNIKKI
jgi:hypothetical protein